MHGARPGLAVLAALQLPAQHESTPTLPRDLRRVRRLAQPNLVHGRAVRRQHGDNPEEPNAERPEERLRVVAGVEWDYRSRLH
ncbi:hypothetical protein BC936DRAFT_149964 [Jimgerdemannia flammicorona]|uniref:Uncharacterized protein n=1 Tax=Jimgerdemannia flammicorona TaxID=994334 RepID=A0A433CZR4_9FUNG|nr:hypothetical protein BC936DRAFT_149964 [Jimgerdemannia flammicorona]